MKMLLLGDDGLLALPLVRQAHAAGHEVFLFTRNALALPDGTTLVRGDRAHLSRYAAHLRELRPDVVIDLSARTGQDMLTLLELFDNIAWRIVLASSFQVYRAWTNFARLDTGDILPGNQSEESPLRRDDLGPELPLSDASSSWSIVRLPWVFGPHDPQQHVWQFVHQADAKRPYILLSPEHANWRVSFCYSENAAQALLLAATENAAANDVFNVAEPTAEPLGEWAHRLANAASYRGKILVVPQKHCPPHLRFEQFDFRHDVALDSSKIRRTLGFSERITLRQAIKDTIAHDRAAAQPYTGPFANDFAAEDATLKKLGLIV